MAKYRRRRYGFKKKLGKWCPNIREFSGNLSIAANETFYYPETICTNPEQQPTLVNNIYTVKNFDISFVFDTTNTSTNVLENIAVYIMYVPQGFNVTANYNIQHPEYILNYKFIGSPTYDSSTTGQQYQPFKVKARLARKLNTGDQVIMFIKGTNQSGNSMALEYHGLCRWWTKAN